MTFFRIIEHEKNNFEIQIEKVLTFKSIEQDNPLREIHSLKNKQIHDLKINCHSIKEIDSCGLSLLNYIKKNVPATSIKFVKPSQKLKKLSALYLIDNNYEL